MNEAQKNLYVTTSWDDGSTLDLRLAVLLDRYGIKGTFYVPKDFGHQGGKYGAYDRRLSEDEIRTLGRTQEVGSHSLTHKSLAGEAEDVQRREITESKSWLETVLGRRVDAFCYPRGSADDLSARLVREAGYRCGRTTESLRFDIPSDPYRMPVSVHAAPFPLRKLGPTKLYWRMLLDPVKSYGWGLMKFPRALVQATSWNAFAKALVPDEGCFHLYGHSWEIAYYDMWAELERFLKYLSERPNVRFVTNSELAERLPHAHPPGQR